MQRLFFLLCFGALAAGARCVLHDADADAFAATPDEGAAGGGSTCAFLEATCCTAAGLAEVGQGTTAMQTAMARKLTDVSDACSAALRKVVCGVCSPDQERIFTVYPHETDMLLCPAFADNVFSQCASAKLDGEEVQRFYSHGSEFLHDLFDGAMHISSRQNENCFNPNIRPCRESDYVGVYSDCVDGFRTAFFQLPVETVCQGGVPLPPPVPTLRCNKACQSGSYLPVGDRECSACPAGTFSVGGGVRIETWKSWPHGLTALTYCEDRYTGLPVNGEDCKHWYLNDTELVSGAIPDNTVTIVRISFELVRPGHVSFQWRVEAERCTTMDCDGFYFEMDGERLINFTSMQGWTTSRFAVPSGMHSMTFSFSKDFSVSVGDDQAMIDTLEINGMEWADSKCTPCPPGSFSAAGSRLCQLCANNTASNELGTANACPGCDPDHYALLGATECKLRPTCTEQDYEMLYSDCRWTGTTWQRDLIPTWIEPHVCVPGVLLPAAQRNLPCDDCQPGFRRIQGYGDCVGCPDGKKAFGSECENCPAGTFAHKVFEVATWNSWPDWTHHETLFPLSASLEHSCVGDGCFGDWRLMGDYVDSGVGHQFPALQILNFTADVETVPARFSFNASYDCSNYCRLSLIVMDAASGNVVESTSYSSYIPGVQEVMIKEPGLHHFVFTFDGFVWSPSPGQDVGIFKMHNLRLSGARDGSAADCSPCANGTASGPQEDSCRPCPAGTSSPGGHAWPCLPCTGNTISPVPGSPVCTQCGFGTNASPNHTACTTNCVFGASIRTSYDLRPLHNNNQMFGPVFDENRHQYFFSLCERIDPSNNPCLDEDGMPIDARVCQVTNIQRGVSIGDLLTFIPLPDPHTREGFNISYTGGTRCNNGVERSTVISFLCDPDAGRGYPALPHGDQTVEDEACSYEFVWTSQYACPLCSVDDWTSVTSECENGVQEVSYVWRERPKRCVGGQDLPPNRQQSCVMSTTSCPAGQYAKDNRDCTPAPPGTFAIGDGERVIVDMGIPIGFENGCIGSDCQDWVAERGGVLKSGTQSSFLRTSRTFLRQGTLSFEFKYSGSANAFFEFRVDGYVVHAHNGSDYMISWSSVEFIIDKGFHNFEWSFRGGATATNTHRDVEVVIRNIVMKRNRYAPPHPIECPGGFSQPLAGQSSCNRCLANQWAEVGSDECHNCPPEQYSLPGSRSCTGRVPCSNLIDYDAYYSPCQNGVRVETWHVLEPLHCFQDPSDEATLLPEPKTVDCTPTDCPPGLIMGQTGQCVACSKGHYPSNGECVEAKAGSAAMPIVSYFDGFQPSPKFPPGWQTNCSGLCGVRGWRARSHFMDSGFHGDEEVDVWASLTKTFVTDGAIEFEFQIDSPEDGLDFFIDGERQNIFRPDGSQHGKRSQQVHYDVSMGQHSFEWVYHQSDGVDGSLVVERVILYGVEGGGSTLVTCPAGTYADSSQATVCTPCPSGYFSPDPGATSCTPCAVNEYQPRPGQSFCSRCAAGSTTDREGSVFCKSPCRFSSGGNEWDLTDIGTTAIGPISSPRSSESDSRFYIQLCEPLHDARFCNDTRGDMVITNVCEIEQKKYTGQSGGVALQMSADVPAGGSLPVLSLSFTQGSGEDCAPGVFRSTTVYIECDPDASRVSGARLTYEGPCRRSFSISALQGCLACDKEKDYDTTRSECLDGEVTVTHVRTSACNGVAYYVDKEPCEAELEVPYYSIAVVGGVILLLVLGVGILVFRNRRIHQSYSQLLERQTGNEMGGLGGQGSTSMMDNSLDLEQGLDTL